MGTARHRAEQPRHVRPDHISRRAACHAVRRQVPVLKRQIESRRSVMQRVVKIVAALAGIVLLPSAVFAQATIAGVIRDASAAVLPGVSVEAASPVLIEKTRTVVSDGTGQYRITDVPPGTYVLTFSLTGFTTMKREGLAVSGSGVVTVNADLRVATVQETVTVTAASPIVDTQSVRR